MDWLFEAFYDDIEALNEYRHNVQPIPNKVYYVSDNIVIIEKIESKNRCVVAKNNQYVIVFDPDYKYKEAYFNCLAKKCNNGTYEEWLHIIGKMISKYKSGKYFGDHILEEHLTNGNCNKSDYNAIIKLQNDSMKVINKFNL